MSRTTNTNRNLNFAKHKDNKQKLELLKQLTIDDINSNK